MYKCKECGLEFDDNSAGVFEAYDLDLFPYDGMPTCPNCESVNLKKMQICEFCDEWSEGVLCDSCSEMAEDVIKYAKDKFLIDMNDLDFLISTYAEEGRWKHC